MSLTLEKILDGSRVFLDANIFVYYFTAASQSCRNLLLRCATRSILGFTSVTVLFEVAHRLMIIEAQQKRVVKGKSPVKQLSNHPEFVKDLGLYEE